MATPVSTLTIFGIAKVANLAILAPDATAMALLSLTSLATVSTGVWLAPPAGAPPSTGLPGALGAIMFGGEPFTP